MATGCVLFICTGNYYRSKFAAAYLRALRPDLKVTSAGLEVFAKRNRGWISPFVEEFAKTAGLDLDFQQDEGPLQLTQQHLKDDSLIIALDQEEHYDLMGRYFPMWKDRITYWEVQDVDRTDWKEALEQVRLSVEELANSI